LSLPRIRYSLLGHGMQRGQAERLRQWLAEFDAIDRRVSLHKAPRGRRPGSGAAFRDQDDFMAKVFRVIRSLDRQGIDPTRENVVCELMQQGVFQTRNIETAVSTLKRYLRRYGLSWSRLIDLVRRS
jgi:hypothetical protein